MRQDSDSPFMEDNKVDKLEKAICDDDLREVKINT